MQPFEASSYRRLTLHDELEGDLLLVVAAYYTEDRRPASV